MDKQQSDETLAMEFLVGAAEDHDGAFSFRYLEPGSEREEVAGQALLRVLRKAEPLSNPIRSAIAALLDPGHLLESRKFVIEPRRKGEQPKRSRDLQIAI
jgi:hypothetical protein